LATLYFAASSATADFDGAATFKDTSGTNATPANGDTLVFDSRGTGTLTTNLNKSTLTGITLLIADSFAGKIGVAPTATTAATYLEIGASTVDIHRAEGGSSGTGSTLILLDLGSTTSTVIVRGSASTSADTYNPPIRLKGTDMTLVQTGGSVGIAVHPGETSTLVAGRVLKASATVSPKLTLGVGCTVTALSATTGTINSAANQTAATVLLDGDAVYESKGSGAHTTLSCDGAARCYYSGSGNITTLNLSGSFDRSRDSRAITIGTTNLYAGATINLANGVSGSTTRTAKNLVRCAMEDVTFIMPVGELF
jgi:hypothetical protein